MQDAPNALALRRRQLIAAGGAARVFPVQSRIHHMQIPAYEGYVKHRLPRGDRTSRCLSAFVVAPDAGDACSAHRRTGYGPLSVQTHACGLEPLPGMRRSRLVKTTASLKLRPDRLV